MSTLQAAVRDVTAFVDRHPTEVLLSGLAVSVVLLLLTIRTAVKSGRPDKWLAGVSLVVGFVWSAEAMWEVATQKMHLPVSFAIFAFTVFETQLAVSMMRAERHYRLYKHPGKHGRAAWLVAVVMGGIAALAGDSLVEQVLRLVVPLLVTQQWWVGMTGDGVTKSADAITWNWSMRRVLVTLGLARPGEHDLIAVDRERQILAIAKVSHRLHSTRWRWRRAWCEMRLRRLTMRAGTPADPADDVDRMLDAARVHVERVWRSVDRTRPVAAEDLAVVAAARAEAEAARTEADLARVAEAAAVASAQVAYELADAESARVAQLLENQAAVAQEQVRLNALEASRTQEQIGQTTTSLQRRLEAAEQAAAQSRRELQAEREARQRLDKSAAEFGQNLSSEVELRRQVEHQLQQEQRHRREAEDQARRIHAVYEAQARQAAELTHRLPQASHGNAKGAQHRSDADAGGTQAEKAARAAWIQQWIDTQGRPEEEEGWAALTKAIRQRFRTSERTARRDVEKFKERTSLRVA